MTIMGTKNGKQHSQKCDNRFFYLRKIERVVIFSLIFGIGAVLMN